MGVINVLIIEDDKDQIQTYQDTIEQHNKNNSPRVDFRVCKTFEEGEIALKSPYYDAAIIDLKLSNTEELEGRKLVEAVYKKLRIPIIIYSGSLGQIDDISENALLKKKVRTERFSDILSEVISIYKTGITRFLRPEGIIDNQLTHIFWHHVSNDMSFWLGKNNPDTLLRYILMHFQEYLEIDSSGDFQEYHPSEVFIKPPIKRNSHTGDLVVFENQLYLILTPACDMVINYKLDEKQNKVPFRKANGFLLAEVQDFAPNSRCLNKKGELDKSKITEYVKNNSYRYHYLPPYLNETGYLIDFQKLKTVHPDAELEKIASISSAFIKDIISRFSSYYSRQGQPTFNQDQIIDALLKKP